MSKPVCITLSEEAIDQLEILKRKTGKSKSKIIRDSIRKEYETTMLKELRNEQTSK